MTRPFALPLVALALLLLPAAGRSQFVDEYFSAIPASPPPGTYAPDVQAAIEEGYGQLALVSSPSDDAHLDPARHQRSRRRAGPACPGGRAYDGDDDRRQLRRPHAQHHRRAIADQCRRAEQSGGAAKRHHGLASRRLDVRWRQNGRHTGIFE